MEQASCQRRFTVNSLSELNNKNNSFTISHDDLRDPAVIFDRDSASNTTQVVNEGEITPILYTIEISEIINYDSFTSIYYEIDISELTSCIVTFPTYPDYMSESSPSSGVYKIEGFRSAADWLLISRTAQIGLANALNGSFTYSVKIGYELDGETVEKTWDVDITINAVDIMLPATDFFWDISSTQIITGAPLISDPGILAPTYTMTITPSSTSSIETLSSVGLGGTSTFNGTTKVLTIEGSKEQVNSHLENITLVSNGFIENYNWLYSCVSSLEPGADTKTQQMRCNEIRYLSQLTNPSVAYTEDTPGAVSGGPTITDDLYDGTGTYSMTVTGPGVGTLAATGSGGTVSFNTTTKVLSIVGTRTQVNSYIDNITLTPLQDYDINFNLTYTVTTPRAASQSKVQVMTIGAAATEVSNLVARSYAKNTATYIFGNTNYIDTLGSNQILSQSTPQIVDVDATNPSYTITFSTNNSNFKFSTDGKTESSTVAITGTKTYVNSQISGIRFYAPKNITGSITMTCSLAKNGGAAYFSESFSITGINTGGTTFQQRYELTASQTFIPNIDSRRYSSSASVLVVGGGGSGSRGAGGGGGGCARLTNNTSFSTATYTTYSISIGAGATNGTGGTTTGFGLSATGGTKGTETTVSGVTTFKGGNSGSILGGAANVGLTTIGFNSTQLTNYEFGGVGGAGTGDQDYYGEPGVIYYPKTGELKVYDSYFGWSFQGSGGPGIEFPVGSRYWYGGGGGGSGGIDLRPIGARNPPYNLNSTPHGYDSVGFAADGRPFPIALNYYFGGGQGRAPDDWYALGYTLFSLATPPENGIKGGGGGAGFASGSAGRGGDGVAVIVYNP